MPTKLVQLHITLEGDTSGFFRELLVPIESTLHELHFILQGAIGWENSHLHQFRFGDVPYEPLYKNAGIEGSLESRAVKLKEVIFDCPTFYYLYDFGDYWRHKIEMIGSRSEFMGNHPPQILDGKMLAPAENCGGLPALEEILKFQKKHGRKNLYEDGKPFWMNYTHIDFEGWNRQQSEAFMMFSYTSGLREQALFQQGIE